RHYATFDDNSSSLVLVYLWDVLRLTRDEEWESRRGDGGGGRAKRLFHLRQTCCAVKGITRREGDVSPERCGILGG
ncbi:MAG: hypothetical protein K2K98_11690, partial [Muribaculaceae bacterium]|nr:hypothetical protein [Muribaculaceae bacterium]